MPTTQSSYLRWLLGMGIVYLLLIWGLAVWDFVEEFQKILTGVLMEPKGFRDHLYLEVKLAFVASAIITLLLLVNHRLPSRFVVIAVSVLSVYILFAVWDFVSAFKHVSAFAENQQFNLHHGLILAFVASVFITGSLLINQKWPSHFYVNAIFLVCVSILFALLFSVPTEVMVKEEVRQKLCSKDALPLQNATIVKELIMSEHEKAVEEIKQRITMDDDWFHKKFILVGGLLAAFLGYLKQSSGPASKDLEKLFETTVTASVLGMACVVSIAIDIHIRSNGMVVQQLALWIKDCVENPLNSSSSGYVGWENFLRLKTGSSEGMHMDYLFSIINAAHFYLGSILLYVMYVAFMFFSFSQRQRKPSNEFLFSLFIFIFVHFTLAIFVFGGNSFPSMLVLNLALWPGRPFSGETGGWLPLLLCLLVSYLTSMRLLTLYKESPAA